MKFERRDTRIWTALVSPRLALRITPRSFSTKREAAAFAASWLREEHERALREIASVS